MLKNIGFKNFSNVFNNEKSQTLVLVVFIVVIFASTIASIASLTTRELEMEEIQERALNAEYTAETGEERAREILSRGYAVRFDGVDDYVEVGTEKTPLFDSDNGTIEQFTIEGWFKIDSLDFNGFKPIITRGIENSNCTGDLNSNKGCVEGSIAVAGNNFSGITPPPGWYPYCPKRLHILVPYMTWWGAKYYTWANVTTDQNHQCTSDGGKDEIKPGIWYHFIVYYNGNPTATYYVYLNGLGESLGKSVIYYNVIQDPSFQQGNYKIRIGNTMKSDVFFPGVIDEVRIYKHPRYCGNPPTFWPNIDPGQSTDPNDPLNHYYGIYGYQDNIPPCLTLVCPSEVCDNWYTQYYPPNYNMETHDLIFYYDFDASPFCYTNPTSGCIKDKSPTGDDNGTPVGFNTNGQEIPAAPNSKNPVYVDVTEYGKIYSLNKDSEQGDLNSM